MSRESPIVGNYAARALNGERGIFVRNNGEESYYQNKTRCSDPTHIPTDAIENICQVMSRTGYIHNLPQSHSGIRAIDFQILDYTPLIDEQLALLRNSVEMDHSMQHGVRINPRGDFKTA